MPDIITVEVIGLRDSLCSPFPCDTERTCGLTDCYPAGTLCCAFDALKNRINQLYGPQISLILTLIDEQVPDHVEKVIEECFPPLPIILVNGTLTPIGRISFPLIKKEIDRCMGIR
ncbi:MAG TPA: hypothetical protein VMS89_09785 [Methanoregulaceae archaeon]|nr:hypothetical protein [Methanoregulaceae archaeon]